MSEEDEPHFSGDLFHKVIALSNEKELTWEEISQMLPKLPRGWYELSRLSLADRIEFVKAFWFAKLPFGGLDGRLEERLENFFEELLEIEIYATQLEANKPFDIHMIYILKDELGFFQGGPPAPFANITHLSNQFSFTRFPKDYLAFLEIHEGFSKYTDTGIIRSTDMSRTYRLFQENLAGELLIRPDSQVINPESLIPFYESFGLHSYQCFYTDWYIGDEMGNVFFSEYDRTISNFLDNSRRTENLAFATFLEWLIHYLEDIWNM